MITFDEAKIRDVADVKGGKRVPKGKQLLTTPNSHPYIRIRDLGKSKILELNSDYEYVDSLTQESIKRYIVSEGDILISVVGTIGLIGIVGKSLHGANQTENCDKITNLKRIDRDYLYYYLKSDMGQNEIKKGTVGAVQPKLPLKNVLDLKIKYPDIDTQRKIAKILNLIDGKITINNEINDNLMQQLNSVYHSIFDSTIFEKKVPLGDYFDVSIGKTPPRKEQWWFSTNTSDVKWVSISDMGSCGTFISSTSEYLTNEAITKFNVVLVPDNTVILSFKLTVGRLAITDGEMATNEAIAHFKTNNKTINPYLYMFLKNYKYGNLGSTSSIATAVNSKIIKSIQFLVPGEKDIAKFNEVAIPMLSQIKEIQHEVRALSELRDSLLPKLMSGEIDVDSIEL